jgi:hypothetical protein
MVKLFPIACVMYPPGATSGRFQIIGERRIAQPGIGSTFSRASRTFNIWIVIEASVILGDDARPLKIEAVEVIIIITQILRLNGHHSDCFQNVHEIPTLAL